MERKRRGRTVRQRPGWNAEQWQRAWELAMMRIDRVPTIVSGEPAFAHALDMLNGAFADGDTFQFELGLFTLLDCCREAVNRGDCQPWWEH